MEPITLDDTELDALLSKATAVLESRKREALQKESEAKQLHHASIPTTPEFKPATASSIRLNAGIDLKKHQPYIVEAPGSSKYAAVKVNSQLHTLFVEKSYGSSTLGHPSKSSTVSSSAEKITIRPMDSVNPPELELSAKEKKKAGQLSDFFMEKTTAGPGWFDMVSAELTDEVKRDLHILRSRAALDPKRHYKRDNSKEFPKVFQFGTIIEGPTEFYSSRLTNKERKQTIVDELLSDAKTKAYMKRRTAEVHEKKNNFTRSKGSSHKKQRKN